MDAKPKINYQPIVEYLISQPIIKSKNRLSVLLGVPNNFFFRVEKGVVTGDKPETQARTLEVLSRFTGNPIYSSEASKILARLPNQRVQKFYDLSRKLDEEWNQIEDCAGKFRVAPPSLREIYS